MGSTVSGSGSLTLMFENGGVWQIPLATEFLNNSASGDIPLTIASGGKLSISGKGTIEGLVTGAINAGENKTYVLVKTENVSSGFQYAGADELTATTNESDYTMKIEQQVFDSAGYLLGVVTHEDTTATPSANSGEGSTAIPTAQPDSGAGAGSTSDSDSSGTSSSGGSSSSASSSTTPSSTSKPSTIKPPTAEPSTATSSTDSNGASDSNEAGPSTPSVQPATPSATEPDTVPVQAPTKVALPTTPSVQPATPPVTGPDTVPVQAPTKVALPTPLNYLPHQVLPIGLIDQQLVSSVLTGFFAERLDSYSQNTQWVGINSGDGVLDKGYALQIRPFLANLKGRDETLYDFKQQWDVDLYGVAVRLLKDLLGGNVAASIVTGKSHSETHRLPEKVKDHSDYLGGFISGKIDRE